MKVHVGGTTIVRLLSGLMVALEVKGFERELDKLKIAAGHKWAGAVNRYYGERWWVYHACFDPAALEGELRGISGLP